MESSLEWYPAFKESLVNRLKSFLSKQEFDEDLCKTCFFVYYIQHSDIVTSVEQLFTVKFYNEALAAYKRLLKLYRKTRKCNISLDIEKSRYCKIFFTEVENVVGKDFLNFIHPFPLGNLFLAMQLCWDKCGDVPYSKLHPNP